MSSSFRRTRFRQRAPENSDFEVEYVASDTYRLDFFTRDNTLSESQQPNYNTSVFRVYVSWPPRSIQTNGQCLWDNQVLNFNYCKNTGFVFTDTQSTITFLNNLKQ